MRYEWHIYDYEDGIQLHLLCVCAGTFIETITLLRIICGMYRVPVPISLIVEVVLLLMFCNKKKITMKKLQLN